jgi:hypothetical protein
MTRQVFAMLIVGGVCAATAGPNHLEVYPLEKPIAASEVRQRSYLHYVRGCLDRLIQKGTDRYGTVHSPIMVSILDTRSGDCPSVPLPLDEDYRVVRRGLRSPGGANLYSDLPTLRAMYTMSRLYDDVRYAEAADRYLRYYLEHMIDDQGLIWWGYHRYYNAHTDERCGFFGGHHEIHFKQANWPMLWKISPEAVAGEIEGLWRWHVIDKKTGEINRHDNGEPGCDFAFTAGEIIYAFAFMQHVTGKQHWLDRAHVVANYYWRQRDPQTNLLATRPNAGPDRFDGRHADTSTPGVYCQRLLQAAALTDDALLHEQALAYLKAYARYGWDPKERNYWASLKLDGTPVRADRPVNDDYQKYQPRGYVDVWQPYVGGYECPIRAAQTYVYAAEITGDPTLSTASQRWAEVIRDAWPPRRCDNDGWYAVYARDWIEHGCYAGQYAKCISFFIRLHRLNNDIRYLRFAFTIADEAVSKLYDQGMLRGHPCKPYYEAVDGVGYLLFSLIQLHEAGSGDTTRLGNVGNW